MLSSIRKNGYVSRTVIALSFLWSKKKCSFSTFFKAITTEITHSDISGLIRHFLSIWSVFLPLCVLDINPAGCGCWNAGWEAGFRSIWCLWVVIFFKPSFYITEKSDGKVLMSSCPDSFECQYEHPFSIVLGALRISSERPLSERLKYLAVLSHLSL